MNMIDIAYTGLQASQIGMNVTSMNVANMLTPGYSRQGVVQSSLGPMGQMGLTPGSGVQVDSIRRISNQYLTAQVWNTTTQSSYFASGQQYLTALEQVLGTESTSLGTGLDEFFAALNELTTQPESPALRQQLVNQATSLAMRFNSTYDFINSQYHSIDTQRDSTLSQINSLTSGIADYNQKITELEAQGGNTSVLRDQRDELVKQLSTLTDINVTEDNSGSYSVTLKGGQPLVSGKQAGTLSAGKDADGNLTLGLHFSNTDFSINPSTGGQLGALYDYETGTLQQMDDAVLGMAQAVADLFNDQLAQGYDLNGQPGKPLFVFDPSNPEGVLQVTDIQPEELGLSSNPDEPGNGDNLQAMIELKNVKVDIPGLGNMSLNEGAASIISTIGIASRENQTELESAEAVRVQAQMQRDNVSAVNQDEEAINLQIYMQAYQANLKVISTGDQIFSDLLTLF